MIRRLISSILLVLALLVGVGPQSPTVRAADVKVFNDACASAEAKKSDFCKNTKQEENRSLVFGTNSLLVTVAQTIVLITGAISVIMIIIGGFKYVLSNGDANATKSAKDTILYAIIGLAVALFAQVIVSFVLSQFT